MTVAWTRPRRRTKAFATDEHLPSIGSFPSELCSVSSTAASAPPQRLNRIKFSSTCLLHSFPFCFPSPSRRVVPRTKLLCLLGMTRKRSSCRRYVRSCSARPARPPSYSDIARRRQVIPVTAVLCSSATTMVVFVGRSGREICSRTFVNISRGRCKHIT